MCNWTSNMIKGQFQDNSLDKLMPFERKKKKAASLYISFNCSFGWKYSIFNTHQT